MPDIPVQIDQEPTPERIADFLEETNLTHVLVITEDDPRQIQEWLDSLPISDGQDNPVRWAVFRLIPPGVLERQNGDLSSQTYKHPTLVLPTNPIQHVLDKSIGSEPTNLIINTIPYNVDCTWLIDQNMFGDHL